MSTLRVSNIQDTAGSNNSTPAAIANGIAKAWVSFTGSSGATRASYNVSSVTRSGVGTYTVNLTNALTDANYSAVALADRTGQSGVWVNPTAYTSSSLSLVCASAISGSSTYPATDATVLHVAVFR